MAVNGTGIVTPDIAELVALRHSARQLSLFPKRSARSATAGAHRSRFRGRGMEFDEVRLYQGGDDIRTIDWRVTARTTVPHTKIFREERERPVLIVVDLRSSMFFGSRRLKSLVAAELATILGWAGLNANDRVGGLIFSPKRQRDIRSHRSVHSVLRFIHALASACEDLLQPQTDLLSIGAIVEDTRRIAAPGSAVVIISDFRDFNQEAEKQLFLLGRHCDLSLVSVQDPLEIELPPPGVYRVADDRGQYVLESNDPQLREAFYQRQLKRQQYLTSTAVRIGAHLLRFSTSEDILPILRQHYGRSPGRTRR